LRQKTKTKAGHSHLDSYAGINRFRFNGYYLSHRHAVRHPVKMYASSLTAENIKPNELFDGQPIPGNTLFPMQPMHLLDRQATAL